MQPLWWLAGLPGRIGERMQRRRRAPRSQLVGREPAPAQCPADQRRAAGAAAGGDRGQRAPARPARRGRARRPRRAAGADPRHRPRSRPASAWCSMPAAATACSVGQSVIDAGGLLGQIIAVTPVHVDRAAADRSRPRGAGGGGAQRRAPGRLRQGPQRPAGSWPTCRCRATSRSATAWSPPAWAGVFRPASRSARSRALRPDDSRAFLVGDVKPAAQLDRGRDVLLLRQRRRGR